LPISQLKKNWLLSRDGTLQLESIYTSQVQVTDSQEKTLQLLVQKHFQDLENGIRPVTSYFNVQYGTIRGEIDVLGRDGEKITS
jgi:RecB family endonuclease NucS